MTSERFVALYWLVAGLAWVWLLYLLDPILTPFLAAGILAYICQPPVTRRADAGRHGGDGKAGRRTHRAAPFQTLVSVQRVLPKLI